ncbi:MAG: hypothetical protein V2A58_13995 [Planctomycetota bacterium]
MAKHLFLARHARTLSENEGRYLGATGDTLGVTCEIVEAATALAFAARPIAALVG